MKFWQKDKPSQELTIFTFHTVSEALVFEKKLSASACPIRLRPVPRKISSSCGTCAAVPRDSEEDALRIIAEENLSYHEKHHTEE